MLLLNHRFAEKQDSKKDLIKPIGLNGFKIVFIQLIEIITSSI